MSDTLEVEEDSGLFDDFDKKDYSSLTLGRTRKFLATVTSTVIGLVFLVALVASVVVVVGTALAALVFVLACLALIAVCVGVLLVLMIAGYGLGPYTNKDDDTV